MRPLRPDPEPCEGPHDLYPHDHGPAPQDARVCSKRFWCRKCAQWADGEKCAPLAAKPAA